MTCQKFEAISNASKFKKKRGGGGATLMPTWHWTEASGQAKQLITLFAVKMRLTYAAKETSIEDPQGHPYWSLPLATSSCCM